MTDNNFKLVIALARSYNSVFSQIEKNVQLYGLNSSEFGVLEMLYHKGPQPVQKVAEKILVTSGTITYVIDKLQKKELVIRKKCEKDGRVFYATLTPQGEAFMKEVFLKHTIFLDTLFGAMSEEKKGEIVKNLLDLQNALVEEIQEYKEIQQ